MATLVGIGDPREVALRAVRARDERLALLSPPGKTRLLRVAYNSLVRSADLEELAKQRVGQVLSGKWTLESLVGYGGVAAVYAARHKNGNRVAIKVLHERYHREKSIRQRFLREARIANQVDHPAIVRFMDDGETPDGAPFLVTTLLSGKNLEDARIAAGGTLPLEEVVRVGALVLSVLEIAHQEGVIHRDLKPANIFKADDGTLFVLDFGLARALEDTDEDGKPASALTSADSLLGTVGFMAPEQAQGRWDLVGPQTDLFAVGATLLMLATGLDVHESNSAQGRLVLAATKPVPKTRERAPSLPIELCDTLDRALAFSQRDRFSTASSFRQALVGTLSQPRSGSLAPPPAIAVPAESSKRTTPWIVVGIVVLLGLVGAAFGIKTWSAPAAAASTSATAANTLASAIAIAAASQVATAAPSATPAAAPSTLPNSSLPNSSAGSGAAASSRPQIPASSVRPAKSQGSAPVPSGDPLDRRH